MSCFSYGIFTTYHKPQQEVPIVARSGSHCWSCTTTYLCASFHNSLPLYLLYHMAERGTVVAWMTSKFKLYICLMPLVAGVDRTPELKKEALHSYLPKAQGHWQTLDILCLSGFSAWLRTKLTYHFALLQQCKYRRVKICLAYSNIYQRIVGTHQEFERT